MSEDVLDDFPSSFPTRFRGYDRDAVDHEVRELRDALDYAQAERDRAVSRALALEAGTADDPASASASATVRWLIDSAEQDAGRIRAAAEEAAREVTDRAEELLRRRVELIEDAQREADECRAQAAEEARQIVHEALEKASTLLRGLQESEVSLQEMFGSGALRHRMPPPRRSTEQSRGQHAAVPQPVSHSVPQPESPAMSPAMSQAASQPVPQPMPRSVSHSAAQPMPQSVPQPMPPSVPQYVNPAADEQQNVVGGPPAQRVAVEPPVLGEQPRL
jgi:hypothetical protein